MSGDYEQDRQALPQTTSIALVEDEPGSLQRFIRVIAADPGLDLRFATASGGAMRSWLDENPVDVLLVDLGLPDISGIDVIRHCVHRQPACLVMVITIFGDEKNMLDAFEAGARGYILKDGTEADLAGHVRNLRNGGSPLSPLIARKLLGRLLGQTTERAAGDDPGKPAAPDGEALSQREKEILDLVARGFTYAEVAQRCGVALSTVHTHIRNIYGKLGVRNKAEAVFEARSIGLLK